MNDHPAVVIWQSIESGDFASVTALLADGFTFTDRSSGQVMTAEQWLGAHAMMNGASSDFSFNMKDAHAHGDTTHVMLQFSGTHDGPLDLSMIGGPVVPATGKTFNTPHENAYIMMDGDLIASIEVEGGAVEHMMQQLGISMG